MRIRNRQAWGMLTCLALGLFLVTHVSAATLNVPGDHTTIQGAIDAASIGDSIAVAVGTYTPVSTINVNKGLTLFGASESGVIIDASAVAGYGMNVSASDVTLSTFTLMPTTPNYPIHASGTGNP